jgi:hypothetical protein
LLRASLAQIELFPRLFPGIPPITDLRIARDDFWAFRQPRDEILGLRVLGQNGQKDIAVVAPGSNPFFARRLWQDW